MKYAHLLSLVAANYTVLIEVAYLNCKCSNSKLEFLLYKMHVGNYAAC